MRAITIVPGIDLTYLLSLAVCGWSRVVARSSFQILGNLESEGQDLYLRLPTFLLTT